MKLGNLNIKEPTTRNARITFDEIEKAALRLFYENGYHGTTINDITQAAGVAAGTFYLYFPSKKVLYQHLLFTLSKDIRREIATRVGAATTRYQKEREGIKAFIEYAERRPEIYNIIWESLYIDRKLFKEYYESFSARYVNGLKEARRQGEIRDLDLEVLSFVLMGITNFVALKVIMDLGEGDNDIERIVDVVMDLLSTGLFTKKAS